MKTFNKLLFFALIAFGLTTQSCKDNILTPVNNTKTADSLVALINTLNSKLVTVNAKDNSLKIQLAKFQSNADSLKALAISPSNYSQSVQYTVYLVDGGNSATGINYYNGGERICKDCKAAGVDGATVTVNANGQTYTKVSADGRAVFNNLYVAGLATVTIAANGYAGCSYTTYFSPTYSTYGGVGTVSLYSSNFSGYSTNTNNVPSYTNGSGSGATFNITVGNSGSITSIAVSNPGSGYKVGDQITIYGGDICDCGGSLTYTVTSIPKTNSDDGVAINASTNVLILPTIGKNATTYTGQLYINKTSMDDTLGRQYLKASDTARYKRFISPNGPYHGTNQTNSELGSDYAQNQYFNGSTSLPTSGNISFTPLAGSNSLTGLNYIYGYPTNVGNYYNPISGNYQFLPGDILSITYNGLTSFATIDNNGKYTLVVPSYQNNPGTTIGAIEGFGVGSGSRIHYQDNYTYLSSNPSAGSTNPTLKIFDAATYVTTTTTSYYQTTKKVDFLPYIETDWGGYQYIGGSSGYTASLTSSPGQTLTRNIFFFAYSLSMP